MLTKPKSLAVPST